MSTKLVSLIAVATLCFCTIGCETAGTVTATGKAVRKSFDLRSFDRVEISNAFQADLRQDKNFQIEVEADEAAMPYLDVHVSGGMLVLAMKSGLSFHNISARATVTMPELKEVRASGASQVKLDGFSNESRFVLDASGASHVDGHLDTGDIDLVASGASKIRLEGHGLKLKAAASGASHADLAKFRSDEANLVASGASSLKVNPKGRLDVNASGASHVTYAGKPALGNIDTSGASSVRSSD